MDVECGRGVVKTGKMDFAGKKETGGVFAPVQKSA